MVEMALSGGAAGGRWMALFLAALIGGIWIGGTAATDTPYNKGLEPRQGAAGGRFSIGAMCKAISADPECVYSYFYTYLPHPPSSDPKTPTKDDRANVKKSYKECCETPEGRKNCTAPQEPQTKPDDAILLERCGGSATAISLQLKFILLTTLLTLLNF